MTQGAQLIELLKRRPHTYLEMLLYGISTCPHKRVLESLARFPGWELRKGERGGLVTWRVVERGRKDIRVYPNIAPAEYSR